MASLSYRIALALAVVVAGGVAVGGAPDPSAGFGAGTAYAQTDAANRALRFAAGDIVRAVHRSDGPTGMSVVEVRLSPDAAIRLRDFTAIHVGQAIDIKVDGRVLSSPVILEPIAGGAFIVSGRFTDQQAREMAAAIGSGSSTVELARAGERS